MKVKVTIRGTSPLLMHCFKEENLDSNAKRSMKNATKEEKALAVAYVDPDGELYVPGICIFASIIEAGKFQKLGKNKMTTHKSSLVPIGVTLLEEKCYLGTKKFEIDSRSVVVPSTGARIMVDRPRLDKWEVSFTLRIDIKEFSEREVHLLVENAGTKCGILSYRISRKGWFGKFEIAGWEIIEK